MSETFTTTSTTSMTSMTSMTSDHMFHSDDDHFDSSNPNYPNNVENSNNTPPSTISEIIPDILSEQQNSDSNTTTTAESSQNTSKKISKKNREIDSNYILFGYIPNYKIPIINIHISYPIDLISKKLKYITLKFGFGNKGITKKSLASRVQSFIYGGNIPKKSVFSYIQSFSSKPETKPVEPIVQQQ